jgi:hypothetical protein
MQLRHPQVVTPRECGPRGETAKSIVNDIDLDDVNAIRKQEIIDLPLSVISAAFTVRTKELRDSERELDESE